jgi:hypothetical protein
MKSALMIFAVLFVSQFGNAQTLGFKCKSASDNGQFLFINSGNSRNGATAKIQETVGTTHFSGAWLFTVGFDTNTLSTTYKYKDMGPGLLTIVEQNVVGKGQFVSASFVKGDKTEILYACDKASK